MFTFEPGPDRWKLGFITTVKTAFKFLENDYGFHLVKTESDTFVRYESKDVFINIYHGRGSYELRVEIGILPVNPNEPVQSFDIQEIMQLHYDMDYDDLPQYQTSTSDGVKSCVPKLATLVERYAPDVLIGDSKTFIKLKNIRSLNSQRMELIRMRIDAAKAWKEKDYAEIERLYESIKESLTPTEIKKLEYSKKHL